MVPGLALITLTLHKGGEIKENEDGNQSLSICALHHIPDSLWNMGMKMAEGRREGREVVKEMEREMGEVKIWVAAVKDGRGGGKKLNR